jgi:osmotically-inducible protein OsmY
MKSDNMSIDEVTPQKAGRAGRWSRRIILFLVVQTIVAGAVYLLYRQGVDVGGTLKTVKTTSREAATTAKVKAALALSQKVSAFDINVETSGDVVQLSGTVPSKEVKDLAVAIAKDTAGAERVIDALVIDPTTRPNPEMERLRQRVSDLEIQAAVNTALLSNPKLIAQELKVDVVNQIVTLEGSLGTEEDKQGAERLAASIENVVGVLNKIDVVTTGSPEPKETATSDQSLSKRVEFELYAADVFDMNGIEIAAEGGVITLSGDVRSRAEKLLAERIAQEVEGTEQQVVNKLKIVPKENETF